KPVHHSGQRKVHGAQAENGEHVRGIDNKGGERDGEHGRDGIHGKKNVAGLDYQEHQQQGGSVKSSFLSEKSPRKELPAQLSFRYRENRPEETQNGAFFGMDFRFALP